MVHGLAVHIRAMIVRSFRHRGLRQLYETDSPRLLKQDLADRVRGILEALALAETMEGFIRDAAPGWAGSPALRRAPQRVERLGVGQLGASPSRSGTAPSSA